MASEWEMAMGVELGMGMGTYHHNASSVTTAPMSSHHGVGAGYSSAHHHHHYYGMPPMGDATAMRVDDLLENLDLSTGAGAHEFFPTAAAAAAKGHHHSGAAMVGEPSPTANSSDHQTSLLSFADEFYIPSEEAAELEWLSKFVDDSYSDMPNYSSAAHAAMAAAAAAAAANAAGNGAGGTSAGQDSCAAAAPGRGARSKRSSRAAAAAWHSLVPRPPSQPSPSSSCSSSDLPSSTNNKPARPNNNGGGSRGRKSPGPGGPAGEVAVGVEGGVRRCTHCASETTPQWRTGPLGPKTLCNACGVRFKSGRLVPEYRPASSPTFVLTQHSNSHRKVMELRRQKELVLIRGSHRDAAAASAAAAAAGSAGAPRPELMFRDYGVC